jgi:serine/threonine protein kinase
VTDAGRWARVKAVFEGALAREIPLRATYLDDACGSDQALRAEVESLLVAHHEAGGFADGLPFDALPVSAVASLADRLGRGTRLGPYEILAKVGEGGMGEVYRAHDTRLDRAVAIKVLPAEFAADPDRLARFEREARAAAALNHPNIVAVYDVGTLGDVSYLVTELLEGQTLRSVLGGTRLPVQRVVEYGAQVARALGAGHDRGILHRDLKPENLFLTRDGRIKVLDFGLAKRIEPDGAPRSRRPNRAGSWARWLTCHRSRRAAMRSTSGRTSSRWARSCTS